MPRLLKDTKLTPLAICDTDELLVTEPETQSGDVNAAYKEDSDTCSVHLSLITSVRKAALASVSLRNLLPNSSLSSDWTVTGSLLIAPYTEYTIY